MPGLKENTQYSSYDKIGAVLPSAVKAAYKVGEALPPRPSPKAVDVTPYQGIANKVSSYTPPVGSGFQEGQQTPLGTVTSSYGSSTRAEKFHPGLDIAANIGTAIKSFTPGTVVEESTGKKQGDAGYGNYVIVKDPEGNLVRYSHLYGVYLPVGATVNKGQQIGTMGNSGQTYSTSGGTGSHLDLRIKNLYGKYIDPSKFIS